MFSFIFVSTFPQDLRPFPLAVAFPRLRLSRLRYIAACSS